MEKIMVSRMKPHIHYLWNGCSFRWRLEENGEFSFFEDEYDFSEYIIPEWQRCHVWTEKQQIEYIQYCFANVIDDSDASRITMAELEYYENGVYKIKTFLIDGLQRTTAVKRFLNGEIKVFGKTVDSFNLIGVDFRVAKIKVKSENEAIKLYLAMNGTGTPHTTADLDKARTFLKEEE